MKDYIVRFIGQNHLESGITFIGLGVLLLVYQFKKNNSFNMSEYNLFSWKYLVNVWALIFMSFVFGIILIFK